MALDTCSSGEVSADSCWLVVVGVTEHETTVSRLADLKEHLSLFVIYNRGYVFSLDTWEWPPSAA